MGQFKDQKQVQEEEEELNPADRTFQGVDSLPSSTKSIAQGVSGEEDEGGAAVGHH